MASGDGSPITSEGRGPTKKPHKGKVPGAAALGIAGFIIITTIFLLIKGKSPRGTCSYDNVYRKATCKVKQLASIPADIPKAVLALHMGHTFDKAENSFTTLQRSNFSHFDHLQELKLVKCGVRDIEPETFADLSTLRSLDLRYNRINTVDESTFKGLASLEYLYLSNNPITQIPDFTFRGIRIENLVIANNPGLNQLSSKAFAGAIIKTLVFNRCSLTGLPSDVFSQIADSLQELHLTNNLQPLELPEQIFKGLHFKVLNLENNGLTEERFMHFTQADEVSLDDNPLGDLDLEGATNLKCIRRLSLGNTGQQLLQPSDFINLPNLEELDLEENDLEFFNTTDLSAMKHLKILDISRNDIVDIIGDFENLESLDSLYMDDNELNSLDQILEPLLNRLSNFTIHNNPLHCNCELKWFAQWLKEHEETVLELSAISCTTPTPGNITESIESNFQCQVPLILNATFDSDGISLVCTAEGDPAPEVIWMSENGKNNKTALPVSYRKDVLQTTCTVAISQDGNFTCTATNLVGTDSIAINTKQMPTAGTRFGKSHDEIEILETKPGMCITFLLLCLLGYVLRNS